jgi:hypothetical protein
MVSMHALQSAWEKPHTISTKGERKLDINNIGGDSLDHRAAFKVNGAFYNLARLTRIRTTRPASRSESAATPLSRVSHCSLYVTRLFISSGGIEMQ